MHAGDVEREGFGDARLRLPASRAPELVAGLLPFTRPRDAGCSFLEKEGCVADEMRPNRRRGARAFRVCAPHQQRRPPSSKEWAQPQTESRRLRRMHARASERSMRLPRKRRRLREDTRVAPAGTNSKTGSADAAVARDSRVAASSG